MNPSKQNIHLRPSNDLQQQISFDYLLWFGMDINVDKDAPRVAGQPDYCKESDQNVLGYYEVVWGGTAPGKMLYDWPQMDFVGLNCLQE